VPDVARADGEAWSEPVKLSALTIRRGPDFAPEPVVLLVFGTRPTGFST
jgi:hypothetical protein